MALSLLGTDVLRDTKRRDLFNIVALNVETKFFSLLKNDFQSFDDKLILLDLVKTSTEDFLTTCYGTNLIISPEIFFTIVPYSVFIGKFRSFN